jgi:hypothetical protein
MKIGPLSQGRDFGMAVSEIVSFWLQGNARFDHGLTRISPIDADAAVDTK